MRKFITWALVGMAALFGLLLAFGHKPTDAPEAVATPAPIKATSAATASVNGSMIVKIRDYPPKTTSQDAVGRTIANTPVREDLPYREIEIAVTQAATAQSEAVAVAQPPAPSLNLPEHGNLGVLVGIIPGIVAADFMVAEVEIPPWVIGMPVKVGADIQANHLQAGAGISIGGKVAATGGVYSRWDLSQQGWYTGIVVRF